MVTAGLLPVLLALLLALAQDGGARMCLPIGYIGPFDRALARRYQGAGTALPNRLMAAPGIVAAIPALSV